MNLNAGVIAVLGNLESVQCTWVGFKCKLNLELGRLGHVFKCMSHLEKVWFQVTCHIPKYLCMPFWAVRYYQCEFKGIFWYCSAPLVSTCMHTCSWEGSLNSFSVKCLIMGCFLSKSRHRPEYSTWVPACSESPNHSWMWSWNGLGVTHNI